MCVGSAEQRDLAPLPPPPEEDAMTRRFLCARRRHEKAAESGNEGFFLGKSLSVTLLRVLFNNERRFSVFTLVLHHLCPQT